MHMTRCPPRRRCPKRDVWCVSSILWWFFWERVYQSGCQGYVTDPASRWCMLSTRKVARSQHILYFFPGLTSRPWGAKWMLGHKGIIHRGNGIPQQCSVLLLIDFRTLSVFLGIVVWLTYLAKACHFIWLCIKVGRAAYINDSLDIVNYWLVLTSISESSNNGIYILWGSP